MIVRIIGLNMVHGYVVNTCCEHLVDRTLSDVTLTRNLSNHSVYECSIL